MDNQNTMTARLLARQNAHLENTRREAETKLALAGLFDQADAERGPLPQPTHLHAYQLHGRAGSMSYDDQTPESILGLLALFPPLPAGVFRGRQGSRYSLATSVPADEVDKYTPDPDSVALKMDGGIDYGTTLTVDWFAELVPGTVVEIRCKLRAIGHILPFYSAVFHDSPAGAYIERGTDIVVFPFGRSREAALRFSPGDAAKSFRPRVFTGARELVAEWAAELDRLGIESRTAYERDKARGGMFPREYQIRSYDSEKLRAGTRAQYECLHTEAALLDRGLAEKHWRAYAAEHGLDPGRYGFDHYAWACAWLARHDLLTDPNGPNGPHKYGSAWL